MQFFTSRKAAFALVVGCLVAGSVIAETSASSYLVARHADRHNDFETSAEYYLDALFFDPENTNLAGGAVESLMALGDFEMAAEIAAGIVGTEAEGPTTYMALVADAAIESEYAAIVELLDQPEPLTNKLTDDLVLGWALIGTDQAEAAFDVFQGVADEDRFRAIGLNHLGLAKAYTRDYDGALSTFRTAALSNFQSPRAIMAEAQILAQLDRRAEAMRRLREILGESASVQELAVQIESGEPVEFSLISSPADGMAEIFFTLADALNGDAPNLFNLFYAQMAAEIRPQDSEALLLLAEMFEQIGRTELARSYYLDVNEDDPSFFIAAKGVAETLQTEGELEEAVAHLEGVISDIGPGPFILVTLGDIYRQLKQYEAAADAYSQRLGAKSPDGYQDWYVHYVRGISYERLGQWENAEADFRKSLDLHPSQPQVLNYLGYSLVERRENLDEALAMIEEAVALRPDSGYIVDSLGWVFYRLGRFEDAVVPMELAVELLGTDPIVNDHLGDVYWMVGREYEARFQWHRAMSFDPEPIDADRIRRKLDIGLDAVLEEEASASDD